ncbi:MAG: chromosomal replication initiator DnaA [Sphingomonas sp. 28-66-16]|nr:MAG: chromosomal replication initiator DnaA [Sphingomonas sp. 28-66-16]
MSQLALPLAWPDDPQEAEFLLSTSNAQAAQHLRRVGAWPVMSSILVGPRKSGRSLLARIFARQTGGTIIDDAERHPEAAIFHAWNAAQMDRRPLLIVADAAPPVWKIGLPDLRSRLGATPSVRIEPPDDLLMQALFERAFMRRGLDARPELVQWLLARVERSYVAISRTVDALDQEVLQHRKRLSIPLARATLASAGLIIDRRAESGEASS